LFFNFFSLWPGVIEGPDRGRGRVGVVGRSIWKRQQRKSSF
jgi:hypothetical protein